MTLRQVPLNPSAVPEALTKAKPLLKSALALRTEGETGTLAPLAHHSLQAVAFSILARRWVWGGAGFCWKESSWRRHAG